MAESDVFSTGTEASFSRSMSLSFSQSSIDFSNSESENEDGSGHSSDEKRTRKWKKSKNSRIELIPPEKKLEKCEKRYRSYVANENITGAMNELMKLPPLCRLVYGNQHWRCAEASMKLSRGYLEHRKLGKQAVQHGEMAKNIILSANRVAEEEKSSFIKCLAEIYFCLGKGLCIEGIKYKEAESSLLKSWRIVKSFSDHTRSAIKIPSAEENIFVEEQKKNIKLALADIYIATKQIDKAMSCLNYIIRQITEKSTSKDASLVPLYYKLAKAEKAKKKSAINYENVVEYNLQAHEILTENHASNTTEVADSAVTLGHAYAGIDSEQSQKTAEVYFKEALDIYKCILGNKDPKTLQVEDAVCKIWIRTEREDEALKKLKLSVDLKKEVFGEFSKEIANTHKLIGSVILAKEDATQAHKHLKRCLEIEEFLYGSKHWKTKATKDTLSLIEQCSGMTTKNQTQCMSLKDRPNFITTIKSKKS